MYICSNINNQYVRALTVFLSDRSLDDLRSLDVLRLKFSIMLYNVIMLLLDKK